MGQYASKRIKCLSIVSMGENPRENYFYSNSNVNVNVNVKEYKTSYFTN